jgi:hypothetical protein
MRPSKSHGTKLPLENARQLDRRREPPTLGRLGALLGDLLESRDRELEARLTALEREAASRAEAGAAS